MAESRLQRWARKKAEASKEAEPASSSTIETAVPPDEQELAVNETLSEHELLAKYDLPDPDAIELGTDITGFLRKEIPELLRRRALRSLWKSNPVLAVLDGLNDYDEDFTDAATAVKGVQTLYKVGEGLIDKSARPDPMQEPPTAEQTPEPAEPPAPQMAAAEVDTPGPDNAAGSLPAADQEDPALARAEAEPPPRYRPRMRFDY